MEVYIITGGAGFIGSHFIRHLLNTKNDVFVINIDKLTYAGNLKNLDDIKDKENYVFIHEDITNSQVIKKVVAQYSPAYVVNFAAESHVDRSISNPQPFIKTNIEGTQVLLEAVLSSKIKKYLQISTDEVYGALNKEDEPSNERSILCPSSPYAASKGAADLLVQSYCRTYGLPINIIRSTNNYGTHQYPEKLIPLLIKNYKLGKSWPIYGDGRYSREWLHVEDNCQAIDMVLHKGKPGEIYNVGTGTERQNLEIAESIRTILARIFAEDKALLSKELISFVEDRKGHDRRYAVNWDKIRKDLGWLPLRSFDEGLSDTVKWYIQEGIWLLEG